MTNADPLADRRERLRLERRRAIIAAARESFLKNGYSGTSMSGLLKTLGGSKATLWAYFRSKEELFAAIFESATSSMWVDAKQTVQSRGSLEATVLDFCQRFMERNQEPESIAVWRLIAAESERFPDVTRIFREHVVRVVENSLSAYFESGVAAGLLRPDDCLSMARVLLSLCTGRLNRMLWSDSDDPSVDAEAAWITTVFLRAFAVQPEKA